MSGLCNLLLQQFLFFNIQTLPNDCSYMEDVHLLFCAHLINISTFLRILNLDTFFHPKGVGVSGLCNL